MKRSSYKKCVYCGADKDLTDDHVPPKLLLTRPYPANLITVPACTVCNKSFQKDDEYTRTMLTIDVRASKNTTAQSNLDAVLRSLQRPKAKGFFDYLSRQANSSVILKYDGAPMGHVFELDKTRVNKTGERIIRALYFVETGTLLSTGAAVRVACKPDLRPQDEDTMTIAKTMKALPDWRNHSVGDAFSYMAAFGQGVSVSAWFMLLYDFFFWLGTVDTRQTSDKNPLTLGTVATNPF